MRVWLAAVALALAGAAAMDDFAAAIAEWLAEVDALIEAEGAPLTPELAAIAAAIGIEDVARVRVLLVEEVPTPSPGSSLYARGVELGLWGPGVQGNAQVFGHGIAVTPRVLADRGMMAHELMHVRQIERFGGVAPFVREYLQQIATFGYAAAPLEREAFVLNDRFAGPPGRGLAGVLGEDLRLRQAVRDSGYAGTVLIYTPDGETLASGFGERADLPRIPASTFKIFSALVALETGVIAGPGALIPWDGREHSRAELNRDLDLAAAFRLSAVPHFQALVREVGPERMRHYLALAGYGNADASGGDETFWLTGGLRISPREQLAFLARLYLGELPFAPATQATVRELMLVEQGPGHRLRGKTGWATLPGGEAVGWWVGWVERGDAVHFFATLLEGRDVGAEFGPARVDTTRRALASLGLL